MADSVATLPGGSREPSQEMAALGRLVGTWEVSGGAEGTVTYEWMEGGHFLIQRVDLQQFGQPVRGVEIIGHDCNFGSAPDEDIRSCFYDTLGNTFRYVYEMAGDTLTIWGGEKGSPAYYTGAVSPDDARIEGEWVYPGGGGYSSVMQRVADQAS